MTDGINVGLNINLGDAISQFKGSLEQFRNNRTYNEKAYKDLLQKYGAAVVLIEKLKQELEKQDRERQKKPMPSKEELAEAKELLKMLGIKGDLTSQENIRRFTDLDGLFNNR